MFVLTPSRSRHPTQRQLTGSALPKRVPAGHGVEPHRGLLLRTGPTVPAELHVQVQGHSGRGPETSVTPGVSQRVSAGRSFTEVRKKKNCQAVINLNTII